MKLPSVSWCSKISAFSVTINFIKRWNNLTVQIKLVQKMGSEHLSFNDKAWALNDMKGKMLKIDRLLNGLKILGIVVL